ncbi:MAG: diaminopimelate decarboxylase [Porticoccaceae bacterium]|nr:MAG: diaminopimelate decarboxylase [Porticoccaceae bacterium]
MAFARRDGELHAEQVPLSAIAREVGTPCYVYSRAALTARFRAWRDAPAAQPKLICYAVKANSNLAVLDLLARLGAGFDIVSGGELQRVLAAGGAASRVVFSGVGKTPQEMAEALAAGIRCFNVESAAELEVLEEVAAERRRPAPVALRVNPDVDPATHPYIATGLRAHKFGIELEGAFDLYRRAAASPHLRVVGLACHIGSQITDLAPFLAALDRLLDLHDRLVAAGIPLRHLDLGGGLGVRYRDETPPEPGDYVRAVSQRVGARPVELLFEPGRSVVAGAGVFLTRVLYLKRTAERNFAIVDGAMNDLLRPALYDAWMAVEAVSDAPREADRYDVVGPVCESGDFLARDRLLALAPGDLLAVRDAGAYGFSMSSNYNSRGRAAEVLVDGDRYHLVRRRETFADLVRGETRLPE